VTPRDFLRLKSEGESDLASSIDMDALMDVHSITTREGWQSGQQFDESPLSRFP
jgi:hypothetical protein